MVAQLTKEEALRETILQVAQQLFQRHGLRKVTMEDIARAAGRGKSSLYYYYKNKEEILDSVLAREIDGLLLELEEKVNQLPTAGARLEAFAVVKGQLLREKTALYSLLYQDIYQYYSLDFANRTRLKYRADEAAVVRRILVSGIQQADFVALSEEEITKTAFVLVTCLYGFEQELPGETYPDVEAHLKLLMNLLIKGLQP